MNVVSDANQKQTRCPHEPGTNAREAIRVIPESTAEQPIELFSDDPDAPILLDISGLITSQQAQDDGSSFVYDLQVYNEGDLSVLYKKTIALGIADMAQVQLTNKDFTAFGPIEVYRGKNFQYKGVRLALTSDCDDGVTSWQAVDGAVYYDLKWAPQCAVATLNTTANTASDSIFPTDRGYFIVNGKSASALNVPVRNPEPMGAPWTLVDGMFTVRLQYRQNDEQSQWQDVPRPGGSNWPQAEVSLSCCN